MSNRSREADSSPWRASRVLIVATLLVAGASAASAASRDQERAARRQLRAASPEALATAGTSAISRDLGDIAVIEHDGSDYNREVGAPPAFNAVARAAVARTFYQTHGDFYDFLVVFTNFEFETGDALAFHHAVRNDVQGINDEVFDNGALYGSPSRLRGLTDMAAIQRYTSEPRAVRAGVPLSATPGDEGFRDTLNVVAHEIGHQWLAFVRFTDAAGEISPSLLGKDGAHWSYLLDTDASLMYGSDWTPLGNGAYRASRIREGYSPLDLYLMGFLDTGKVPPFTLLHSPGVDPAGTPQEGAVITATPETITVEQVIAAEGPRSPGFAVAPKTFRAAFIFLTAQGVEPSDEDLAAVDRIRQAFAAHFFALTHGVALVETRLAEDPSGEPGPAVDTEKAVAWLVSQQASDGRWEDSSRTAIRDTAAVLETWTALGLAEAQGSRGRFWLEGRTSASLDFLARRAGGLGLGPLTSAQRSALASTLLAEQNPDGGFGAGPGYSSDPLDTALALRALAALQQPAGAAARRALSWLATAQVPSAGGWPVVAETTELSTIATAHVLLALQDWQALPEAQVLVPGGLAALLSRRNPDGGFGESPSTSYASALALQVLLRAGAATEIRDGAVAWLQQNQLLDGSWEGSTYATALALSALTGSSPNLVVPPDNVTTDPPAPMEGDTVRVSARIRNAGTKAASASVARLFDGDPAEMPAVDEVSVPALDAGESVIVTFELDTAGRAGTRTLYVVADAAGEVPEAREDDNATQRTLTVAGLLPDLTVPPGGLRVDPDPPEAGETVQVSVTVRNAGERQSQACALRIFRGDPRAGGVLLGELLLPPVEADAARALTLPWDTTGQEGQHELHALVDAASVVYESDELNNGRSMPVRVTGPQAGGVDLAVGEMAVSPSRLQTLPQSVVVTALVRNLGRDSVVSTVTLTDGEPPAAATIATQTVDLAGRSSTLVAFPLDVDSPGSRRYFLTADLDDLVIETDEANNVTSAVLTDPGDTYDVEIRSDELNLSASDLVAGDMLVVTAVLRNRGTASVTELPVILGHAVGGEVFELGRRLLTLAPGASTTLTFEWKAAIEGDPVALVVRADPFGLLTELSEANNEGQAFVRVRPSSLPNLSVSGAEVSLAPDPPLEAQDATVSAVVRNPSPVEAGASLVRFYIGDPAKGGVLIGEETLAPIPAHSSATATRAWTPSNIRGQQGLFVVADALEEVEEHDEADNQAFRPFAVTGIADLVLTAADVTFDPGYPRSGESVTIRAVVRNLGQQPAAESLLRAEENDSVIGEVPIPRLDAGQWQSLEISWLPSSPPGERRLALVADADDVVSEQDEGNNLARRTVVVQDADIFLTEPFFSPDGDGVKDETSLGYRATGAVSVVVANSRGMKVRTLVGGDSSGSVTWDGRNDTGRVLPDGAYTFTVEGAGGRALARATAVLDTDRSPLHNAAETGFLAVRGLTCNLPISTYDGSGVGPAWMPNDEEALFIIWPNQDDLTPGLIRVDPEGNRSYLSRGDWWAGAWPPFVSSVSPDGRRVVVRKGSSSYLVDLQDGSVREAGDIRAVFGESLTWSPDGRWLLAHGYGQPTVLTSEGEFHAELPSFDSEGRYFNGWQWSPDSAHLLGWTSRGHEVVSEQSGDYCIVGVRSQSDRTRPGGVIPSAGPTATADGEIETDELLIVRPDGSEHKRISLPFRHACYLDVAWRGDDSIYMAPGSEAWYGGCGFDKTQDASALVVDPRTGATRTVSSALTGTRALSCFPGQPLLSWSPDGSRALRRTSAYRWGVWSVPRFDDVVLEDASRHWSLWGGTEITPSPWGSVGSFAQEVAPATQCNTTATTRDVAFALSNLQNLTATFTATRLLANNGLLVRATVSDLNLDRHQLDYAVDGALDTWYPIGPSSDVPIIDDALTVWVPPTPGRYLLRLRAWDRAGNARTKTQVVAWDRRSSLANITFDEALISPNGDTVRDAVTFKYLVVEPTRVDVRIAGPGTSWGAAGPVVRQLAFEYSTFGTNSFVWDGRDEGGQVVADGRYTVSINELPFRIEVDATPPDVAVAYENIRAVTVENAEGRRGVAVGDKRWHVWDAHLKGDLVIVPARDANGAVIYDNGVPRPWRVGGRTVDRLDKEAGVELSPLVREDYGGIRTTVTPHFAPEILLLMIESIVPPDNPAMPGIRDSILPPIATDRLYRLGRSGEFSLFTTTPGTVRFEVQEITSDGTPVGSWAVVSDSEAAPDEWVGESPGDVSWLAEDLVEHGLAVGPLYRGRFALRSSASEVFSQDVLFTLCDERVALVVGPGEPVAGDPSRQRRSLRVEVDIAEPIAKVEVITGFARVPLVYHGKNAVGLDVFEGSVIAPIEDCGRRRTYSAAVIDALGEEHGRRCDICAEAEITLPLCPDQIALQPANPMYCAALPEVGFEVWARTGAEDVLATIEYGPAEWPVQIGQFPVRASPPSGLSCVPGGQVLPHLVGNSVLDTRGLPDGALTLRGRLSKQGEPEPLVTTEVIVTVDHTPPLPEILLPPEGGQLCLEVNPRGRELGTLLLRVSDAAKTVKIGTAEFRHEDGPWMPFEPVCLRPGCPPYVGPGSQSWDGILPAGPNGVPSRIGWDATNRPEGEYAVRLEFCDESGNHASVERRFWIYRQPAPIELVSVSPEGGLFSPNGDGQLDEAVVMVRTAQSSRLSAELRIGTEQGAVVRVLPVKDPALPGVHAFTWNGRNDQGGTAADGRYVIAFEAQDACGGRARLAVPLVVDNTPPRAAIVEPLPDAVVRASVDVRGEASDSHFASFELAYGVGPQPADWSSIAAGTHVVLANGLLGRWDVPSAEGVYSLRLVAVDQAQNRSEVAVAVSVVESPLLGRLGATPALFSPNGDGRRETTTIEYELLGPARVTLDVAMPDGTSVRSLAADTEQGPGVYEVTWDGLADGGPSAPDADYVVRLRAADTVDAGLLQQATAGISVDRAPPAVAVQQPEAGGFLKRADSVVGSIEDAHLLAYRVSALQASGGAEIEIGRGVQNRQDAQLGALAWLTDGAYRLRIEAEDQAENESLLERPFTLDSIPPQVRFDLPLPGAVLDTTASPVAVVGAVVDANLDHFTLSAGLGLAPAVFDSVARGEAGGEAIPLGAWAVGHLPDDDYTLRLEGVDRAGSRAEVRRSVVLDGTPPEASIDAPADGGYVTAPRTVDGTAVDRNLDGWTLEFAQGEPATAYEWSTLASGQADVRGSALTNWAPLPPDGVYTLRLTVRDRAGHVSTTLRRVTVDQTPPAAPTGLVGSVIERQVDTATVRLDWDANTEPDLAGYRVSRDGQSITPQTIPLPTRDDPGRPEGQYSYAVVALDEAGNVSAPASVRVTVDLTPPHVEIQIPTEGAAVSGAVDVRGTAWSAPDFKEYRLYVGATDTPTSWTLLSRSTLPRVGQVLGTWAAFVDGPYVLALEAEDLDGNAARVTRPVVVDTDPPEPPVLVSVANAPEATALTSTWLASPSADVEGYLLYRGERLANAPGLVIGSLREFLIADLVYADADLPDGRHCYHVLAMDRAGNMSAPSNEICSLLDNRPPSAVIVDPPSGTRFEYPVHVVADTPDTDIASVQIQIKPHAETTWQNLGPADAQVVYEATLDPSGLALGDYDLRAVATDLGGRTDPAPSIVTVTYGDATPPAPPTGLVAHVDGRDVHLTWNANTEPDLAGYHVFRDGERVTAEELAGTVFDEVREPSEPEYHVTAIDGDGNESAPSAPAYAVIYEPTLFPPDYPVTLDPTSALSGDGARPQTSVEILRDDSVIAVAFTAASSFHVGDVPLAIDGNVVQARGVDAAGNRSVPSGEVVVIRNEPPAAVTGLAADVAGSEVTLRWEASSDADRHGHVVYRGGQRLTTSARVTEWTAATASSSYDDCWAPGGGWTDCDPWWAVDGDDATAWLPAPGVRENLWTGGFARVLVDRVVLRSVNTWGEPTAIAAYRIEARWNDRYLPLVRVEGNDQALVTHVLPMPFATDSLRVVIGSEDVGLAEVEVWALDALPADQTSVLDSEVPDGYHDYDVRVIDRYGAESAPATLRVTVGEAQALAAPVLQGSAQDDGSNCLVWQHAGAAGFVLQRATNAGGPYEALARTDDVRSRLDAEVVHGTEYFYVVYATDAFGNESPVSNEVALRAERTRPPPPPSIFFPTDAAHPITVDVSRTDVRGGAEADSLVTLDVNGVTVVTGIADRQPVAVKAASVAAVPGAFAGTVSPDGRTIASLWDDDTTVHLTLVDVESGATREIAAPAGRRPDTMAFSPDSRRLAYTLVAFGDDDVVTAASLVVLDLDTSATEVVFENTNWIGETSWSHDGGSLAFVYFLPGGTEGQLAIRDMESGSVQVVDAAAAGEQYWLRWSPDDTRIAFFHWLEEGTTLRTIELSAGEIRTLRDDVVEDSPPSWSPDGRRLAVAIETDEESRITELDPVSGASASLTDGTYEAFGPAYDPTGAWLTYLEVHGANSGPELVVRAFGRRSEVTIDVGAPQPMDSMDNWDRSSALYEWTAAGRLALSQGEDTPLLALFDGSFELEDVPLGQGENVLVARSTSPAAGLVSADSEPVRVTVSDAVMPDLSVIQDAIRLYPAVPVAARTVTVTARVANAGVSSASDVGVSFRLRDASGVEVLARDIVLDEVGPGQSEPVSIEWIPEAAGELTLSVAVDPDGQIDELREDNNVGETVVRVVAVGGVVSLDIESDRTVYPSATTAVVTVSAINAGPSLSGMLRTTVEDTARGIVAVLDERAVSLDYGETLTFTLAWGTGRIYAGSYAFHALITPPEEPQPLAADAFPFSIAPDLTLAARLVPRQARVAPGTTTALDARVENNGTNSPLLSAVARLRITVAGGSEPPVFEATLPIVQLLPGGLWTGVFDWPVSVAAGSYAAELTVYRPNEPALVTAHAAIEVVDGAPSFAGTLELQPAHVLAGETTDAVMTITDRSGLGLSALPVTVEVVEGTTAASLASAALSIGVEPFETRDASVRIETSSLLPGTYPTFLRAGEPPVSLDRAVLRVHGVLTPPIVHSPADGSHVSTSHPTLVVENASSAEGAVLAYEFEIYADSDLTMPLKGARDVVETAERTAWTVVTSLGEDRTFYWRARATDGFSTSSWTAVASLTVDAVHVPPQAPVPESPQAGERVAVLEPTLVVLNSFDPDSPALRYDFRLAADPEMAIVLVSAADVPSGPAFTSWRVPLTLEENATYYWCARARDESSSSPWSAIVSFVVDAVNEPPTAPVPVFPAFAERVAALSTALVVGNAQDPESQPLSYRFQVDPSPSFDSPDLQEAADIEETLGKTAWTPPTPLRDHTTYYWRAAASDGHSYGPWALSQFSVNLANEPPDAPVPLAPANGQIVATLTPELRVRNALDPDGDVLTYEFLVTDESEQEVARVADVQEGAVETGWALTEALVENGSYAWSARAHDAELAGPWTPPWTFRVNSVQEPPSAPTLVAPSEGVVLEVRRPELVVGNATSPDGLALSYTFELSWLASDGTLTVLERVSGIPEAAGTTGFTVSAELPDGSYSWTARAEDPVQPGPWMESAHFQVAVEQPPSPPTGLEATPGDSRVRLTWNTHPEPEVVGYRVYRSLTSGEGFGFVAQTAETQHLDLGLENGVTFYYVVTAIDARFESGPSSEVAATPSAATAIEAEVRYSPDRIAGDCLFARDCRKGRRYGRYRALPESIHGPTCGPEPAPDCPTWLRASVELPPGYDAAAIERSSVRLAGSVSADPQYFELRDDDLDGNAELRLRFDFDRVAPLLRAGANELSLTGRTPTAEFFGSSQVTVLPLEVSLWITPRTLNKRSRGQDVMAHLSFRCVDPRRVETESLRLNGLVRAGRVVSDHDHHLIVKFDRCAVAKVLPTGHGVRVEVSGTADGIPFAAVDHIRVTE